MLQNLLISVSGVGEIADVAMELLPAAVVSDGCHREQRLTNLLGPKMPCPSKRAIMLAADGSHRAPVYVAAVADVAFETVDGEVQAAEAAGFVGLLDAVGGQLAGRIT